LHVKWIYSKFVNIILGNGTERGFIYSHAVVT